MLPSFILDPRLYQQVLQGMNSLHFTDHVGAACDLDFIKADYWLADSAVIDRLVLRKGTWDINLLFAHHTTPLRFLSRRITSHSCPKRAAMMAGFMRRLAAKDQRGTLRLSLEHLDFNCN
jgi:hypothetical protein